MKGRTVNANLMDRVRTCEDTKFSYNGKIFRSSSHMFASIVLLALLASFSLVCVGMFSFPTCAHAATWPLCGTRLSTSLGFHEHYKAGSHSYAHSGIDVPGNAGARISAPVAGTVCFTGSVPSGDSSVNGKSTGKTMHAVSIKMANGRTVTLMPFARSVVKRGQNVDEGDVLGTLAAHGDRSSSKTHLHMGLKKGGVYYNPLNLFGVLATQKKKQQEEQSAAVCTDEEVAADAQGADVTTDVVDTADSALVDNSALQDVMRATNSRSEASESTQAKKRIADSFGSISSGAVSWSSSTSDEPSVITVISKPFDAIATSCLDQLDSLGQALQALACESGIPYFVVVCGFVVLLMLCATSLLYACVHWVVPFARRLWSTGISLLSRRGEDGTIHKLFPASSSSFMSRGRLVQRR